MTGELEHPTYPNPTVADVLCHIDFVPSPDGGWQASRPIKFLQLVSGEYPNFNAVPPSPIFMSGQIALPQQIGAALRLSNEENNRYMAVGDSNFVFGHRQGYPGWETFREKLFDVWRKFISVASPRGVLRIGLRYVNIIPRTQEHPLISDWLMSTATIPETVIRSKSDPFLLRTESWIEKNSLLVVTVGLMTPPAPGRTPKIIFDINRMSVINTDPGPENLLRHIEVLHTDVWREFASAKTQRLEAYLKGVAS